MRDIFEPRHEPAKSIYAAFQSEAAKRKERSIEDRLKFELESVFNESRKQANIRGLIAPTFDDVVEAERYARGTIDYAATWTYQVVRIMKPRN